MNLSTFLPGIVATAGSILLGLVAWLSRRLIKKNRGMLLDLLHWATGRVVTQSTQKFVNARRYFRNCLESNLSGSLPIPGRAGLGLSTDESFVRLVLDQGLVSSKPYTHANLLQAGSRLIIVGDPGSGKSSLVKRIMRDECRRGLSDPGGTGLPILIRLPQFVPPATIDPNHFDYPNQIAEWALAEVGK